MNPLFSIDSAKCTGDGRCVAVCSPRILELTDGAGPPRLIPELGDPSRRETWSAAELLCMGCGHCVAICPEGAFAHRSVPLSNCPELPVDGGGEPAQVERLLRSRRSIRAYRSEPVERHLLTELIEVARYAPSGHNLQPARWLVVYDKEEVQRLAALVVDWLRDLCCRQPQLAAAMHVDRLLSAWEAGTDRICRGAPHLVMVHADERGRTAQTDGVIAMTYFDLMASARGLGTCWAGYFNRAATVWPPLVEALALPEGHRPVATMMVGYPRFRYRRLVPRRQPSISWR